LALIRVIGGQIVGIEVVVEVPANGANGRE